MTDRRRREMIARYLDGMMPAREASRFRERLEFDAGMRRLLEAEQLIRSTFERDRRAVSPDHAFTRKRVMAILATLPPADGTGVLKGTVVGISHLAKTTILTMLGVGAVVIATQFPGGPAEGERTHRRRTEQTASARSDANAPLAAPGTMPLADTASRILLKPDPPTDGARNRAIVERGHRANLHARPDAAFKAPQDPHGTRTSSGTAIGGNRSLGNDVAASEGGTVDAIRPPNRRTLPVLRSDSVNVRVHVNFRK